MPLSKKLGITRNTPLSQYFDPFRESLNVNQHPAAQANARKKTPHHRGSWSPLPTLTAGEAEIYTQVQSEGKEDKNRDKDGRDELRTRRSDSGTSLKKPVDFGKSG